MSKYKVEILKYTIYGYVHYGFVIEEVWREKVGYSCSTDASLSQAHAFSGSKSAIAAATPLIELRPNLMIQVIQQED